MKATSLVAALVSVLLASGAFAQDYDQPGLYAQLNGTANFESFDNVPNDFFTTAIGVGGRLGYRMSPNLAVEGMVEWSGDFADVSGVDLTTTLLSMNGRYYLLTDQFQPYVTAGLGWGFADTNFTSSESGFVGRFGVGLDYYFSKTWGLTSEFAYNVSTGDLEDFNYMALGWGVFMRF